MELRQLEYFLRAVQMRNISKAAIEVRVAQPALSRQIRQLEQELGVQLLYRDGRGVAPTQIGARFAKEIGELLQRLEQCKADVMATRGIPMGDVTLGTTFAIGSPFLALLISEFQRRYPGATLRVVEGFSYHVVEWLQTGRIDMGIVYYPEYYSRFSGRTLTNQSLYLIGPRRKGHRHPKSIQFAKAIQYPLIMPVSPNSISALVEKEADARGLKINLKMEVDSISTIKQLLREGRGFTILQHTSVHENIEKGELFAARIDNPRMTRPFALCYPQRGVVTLAARKLTDLVQDQAAFFLKSGRWVDK
jgi:LysR family nitrogen assimilation transcriptional regulator